LKLATKIILPGVGHFDHGMRKLHESGLVDVLHHKVTQEKVPILGICLGAQMMCNRSEEGTMPGLSWFDAEVKIFDKKLQVRVPHMGWNYVERNKNHPIVMNLPESCKFYFVHSYHMVANQIEDVLFETNYGYNFVSALQKENMFAFQFHPEKSHKYGMQIFRNFVEYE
jgi:glutamine amidotransferase